MASDYQRVRDAIVYIEEHAEEQPSLDEVASHVGLSPGHFQRLFRRWAGVSPKRFLQHLTAARAKQLLRDSEPVLDTAFSVGLSGSGRLHDLMVSTEAVTPGEYKTRGEGLVIRHGLHETPFGTCFVAATDRGICAGSLPQRFRAWEMVAEFEREWAAATCVRDGAATESLVERVFAPTADEAAPLPLHVTGTNFQLKVW